MKGVVVGLALVLAVVQAAESSAELQNVEVGGQIIIFGEYYTNVAPRDDGLRIPASWLRGRPIGNGLGEGIFSGFAFDRRGSDSAAVSQWTRLSVEADFTEGVSTYIEFDQIGEWGTAFRSNYVTGLDAPGIGSINLYQAYIQTEDMFGMPLSLRLGRQELRLGSEWLSGGNDDGSAPSWGLAFDGIRATYGFDKFTLDAWAMKLAEGASGEADGDMDFYGIYGSYTGIENVTLDAYWMFLRDGSSHSDTQGSFMLEGLEDIFGVDAYPPDQLHTIGVRTNAIFGRWDLEAELAYQFGDASHIGSLFRPVFYGDDSASFGNFGLNLQLGYALKVSWDPRVYLAFAWLEGEDNRDITARDRAASVINPFYTRDASVSFNRLFSNWSYSSVLDGTDLSNALIFHTGVNMLPTEKIEIAFDLGYYLADETFDRPQFFLFPFWTKDTSNQLGFETDLSMTYNYSEDLYFSVGWDHLFVGQGLEDGNFNGGNGLDFNGGSDSDDVDYLYFETGIFF